ncbi:MAG: PAS domain S-box protein, partial [Candidatus Hadarchaeota archaeon]|nr:PAS domain S-box protein [Candidatus Hadarchaeota archaeon]
MGLKIKVSKSKRRLSSSKQKKRTEKKRKETKEVVKAGNPGIGVVEAFTDATERKRADDEEYKRLFEELGEPAFLTVDEKIVEVNKTACEKTGFTRDELIGMDIIEDLTGEFEEAKEKLPERKERLKKGKPIRFESKLKRKDGSTFPVELTSTPIKYRGKQATFSIERDITKRKWAEEALRESEKRFRAIFETAQDSIFIKDRTLRYTQVNPAMERLFGLPTSKLIGLTDEDLFGEEAGAHIKEVDSRVLSGETVEEEYTKPVKGVPLTFHIIKVPMRDSFGEITGLCGIARDVTERKRGEEALRESEEKFKDLARSSADRLWEVGKDGKYIFASGRVKHILGYEPEELIGKTPFEFMPKDEAKCV